MRLRKEEMVKLREVLDVVYEDQDECIKAMYAAVVDCLEQRDTYGVGIKFAGRTVAYGPFYDLRKAKKEAGKYASILETDAFIQPLNAPSKLNDPEEK